MKILMIIAQNGFRDEEYKIPYDYFKNQGLEVEVASPEGGECEGKYGMIEEVDFSFSEVDLDEYRAIMIVGGPGAKNLENNKDLYTILGNINDDMWVISAICYSSVILAKAGLLMGKNATVWDEDGKQSPVLEKHGAKYINQNVVVDGRLITGNGPEAAEEFAEKVVQELNKKQERLLTD